MTNLELIQEMYALFAEGDLDAIRRIFAPDLRWNMMHGFPGGGQYVGMDAVFEHVFGYFRHHWTDWRAHSVRLLPCADSVIVIGYYEGIYAATGRATRADFAVEYRIADGRIVEYNQFTDTLLIAEAMMPAPPTPPSA